MSLAWINSVHVIQVNMFYHLELSVVKCTNEHIVALCSMFLPLMSCENHSGCKKKKTGFSFFWCTLETAKCIINPGVGQQNNPIKLKLLTWKQQRVVLFCHNGDTYMLHAGRVLWCHNPGCSLPGLWHGISQLTCRRVWSPPQSSSGWSRTRLCHHRNPAGCWSVKSHPETQHRKASFSYSWTPLIETIETHVKPPPLP